MHDNMKVLFATDFSQASKVALQTAELLHKTYEVDISLLNVITQFWRYFVSSGLYEKEAMQRLETWSDKIDRKSKSQEKLHVLIGNAADSILQQADIEETDLILLGGESVRSKEHFLTGTVAEAVVRSAHHPVLLAKKPTLQKILCGIDGSLASQKALKEAIEIARRFKAELCVLYVLTELSLNPLGMSEEELKKCENKFKEEKTTVIEKVLDQFDFTGIQAEFKYLWGLPSRVILDLAEDFDYDLIVIGATGETLLRRVLMGSTAEKVLRHTPCSLLVTR